MTGTFMVEAEAETLLAMGEEMFEAAIYTATHEALRKVGLVRTMAYGLTYTGARAAAVARFKVRGAEEGFTLAGIFGAKEVALTTRAGAIFIFIGEL